MTLWSSTFADMMWTDADFMADFVAPAKLEVGAIVECDKGRGVLVAELPVLGKQERKYRIWLCFGQFFER